MNKDFQGTKDLQRFLTTLPPAPHIVLLTGAGISAESGVGTFRGQHGLWQKYSPEEVATPEAFAKSPQKVHDFYNLRRARLFDPAITPNAAHKAVARLQETIASDQNGTVTLITQNVDNLHERAGSQRVLHMHGTIFNLRCTACNHEDGVTADNHTITMSTSCPACTAKGTLRPAVVWFGERPQHMETIETALAQCDLFVAIGTSGHVYPAAGFGRLAAASGAFTAEINLAPSQNAGLFDIGLYGPATKKVPFFIDKLLESQG